MKADATNAVAAAAEKVPYETPSVEVSENDETRRTVFAACCQADAGCESVPEIVEGTS